VTAASPVRGRAVAVLVARGGQPPLGADETVAEADGMAVVVGDGAEEAAAALTTARRAWWGDTGPGMRTGPLASVLVEVVSEVPLLLLPASADGRDLAPRLAAVLGRPLLAYATRIVPVGASGSRAELSRLDGRLAVEVESDGPAVATLVPGVRGAEPVGDSMSTEALDLPPSPAAHEVEVFDVIEPDPETMDLTEAGRVVGGGGGLVPRGVGQAEGLALFTLLGLVAGALGASVGATRVATDAGWIDHDRQIGTTGVTVHPDLYVAFGVSGASQHTGGLGAPRHVVSVNTDPSCPMTAMADLGIVTDARGLLLELAHRLEVDVPAGVVQRREGARA
jgi:electron transfer flavoprotein alpha subunit